MTANDELVVKLFALATYAEKANHWVDDKRLMDAAGVADVIHEGIDRIEELEAKLAEYRMGMSALDIQWVAELQRANVAEAKLSEAQFERDNNRGKLEIKKRELSVAADRIEELEAKLAKAVEALEEIIEIPTRRYQRKIARRTLAELTGGKDD